MITFAKQFFLFAGKPGRPDIEVTGSDHKSVSLKWTAPDNNGAPIFTYIVEYRLESSRSWVRANEKGDNVPETSYTVNGLKENKEYVFRVSAENIAGVGEPSNPTQPVKIKPLGMSLK